MNRVTRIFDILLHPDIAGDRDYDILYSKSGSEWKSISATEYRRSALNLAVSFQKLGLRKGDRVATVVRNSIEWNVIDMALLLSGLIQVPLYATLSNADYVFILREAGARLLISDDLSIPGKLSPFMEELPRLRHILAVSPNQNLISVSSLMNEEHSDDEVQQLIELSAGIGEQDTATIIYTSGTTGNPKGVMLSHGNMVSNFKAVIPISGLGPDDIALSALPLCHVYERMLNYAYQAIGMRIYYAESLLSIADNLREVKPTIFCAVPRILEKFYDRMLSAGRSRPAPLRCVYLRALNTALRYDPIPEPGPGEKAVLRIFDKLVYHHWRQALGGRLRIIVSGGASLQPRLARLFWAAGIKVTEGYGLTETSPVIAVNYPNAADCRIGTVGPVLPGVEVKFAEDGEILCRGPNVMQGYFLNPELTDEVIDADGWLRTGDIGCMVEERFLKITDRKKEMFKTSGGKYIAPQVIENHFKESSFIEHIMVVGENRRFPAALIIPDFVYLRSWCEVKGLQYPGDEEAVSNPYIYKRIEREVQDLNQQFSRTEQVKRFILLNDEWTQENGLLSPTLKLRRSELKTRYIKQILAVYSNESGDDKLAR
jgi:long-chain acyl-CoA synthetase